MTDAPPIGHVKIARKAFDPTFGDEFWLERREFSRWEAWVDVIQLACFSAYRYVTRFGPVDLERGEFIASRRHLAKRWNWTEKKVRVWLATVQKRAQLLAKRETEAGTVYLIVNYDTYQSNPKDEGPEKGQPKGPARAQQGPKREAVKAVKAEKRTTSDAEASEGNAMDRLPKATVDAAYLRWSQKFGAIDYPRLRKALRPLFDAQPLVYTGQELAEAVEAFYDGAQSSAAEWRGKWTPEKFASELHNWVRLGTMELVDEWGIPTERGRASGVFAESR